MHHEQHDQDDPAMTLAEAARSPYIPRPVAPSTVYRWHRPGIRAASGERIRLRAEKYGGRVYVRPSALRDFAERLAEADAAADVGVETTGRRTEPPAPRSEDDRQRAVKRARAELDAAGI